MKPLAERLRVVARKIEDVEAATIEARRMPARHKLTKEEASLLADAGFNPREFVASDDDDPRYPAHLSSFGSEVTVSVYPVEKGSFFGRERKAPKKFMAHVKIGGRVSFSVEYKTRELALEGAHKQILGIGRDIGRMIKDSL